MLTGHVVVSVGLLGEVAAFLAIAVRASGSHDPAFAAAAYDLLAMFQLLFGIPLSFLALASGVTLGLGTKWGVLRHPWVAAKLVLLLSVLLMGALVLGPDGSLYGAASIGTGQLGLTIFQFSTIE